MSDLTREWVRDAIDKVMIGLHERRQRLGLAGLPEPDAQLRALALEAMPTEAFQALLAVENDEARERQIMALENAQRRHHVVVEIYPAGRSDLDDRIMYRWRCACGEEAKEDYMDAETAKAHWGRHAGWLASGPPEGELVERTCRQCGATFQVSRDSKDRYCSRTCAQEYFKAHRK